MSLKGNLETFFLTGILKLLHQDCRTGALQIKSGKQWVNVIIRRGDIVYAMSAGPNTRLGNILRNQHVITVEQLEQALEEGKEKKMALGKILVERELLTPEQIETYIRMQVEEIIFQLFSWTSGSFEYKDAKLNLSGFVEVNLGVMALLLEASRRVEDFSVLQRYVPSINYVFRKCKDVDTEIKLSPLERWVLSVVDGRRTVEQLIVQLGMDKLQAYKIFYSLVASAFIEKAELPVPRSQPEPEEVDEDFTGVITAYSNILQIMWQHVEPEIGNETAVMFEECKPEALPGQKELFNDFQPNTPGPGNIFTVQANLEQFSNIKNERSFLIESFNRYILNILDKVPEILGTIPTRDMLQKIEKILPHITKYMEEFSVKSNLIEDVRRIMALAKQQISDEGKSKPSGLLSIFKR